MMEPTLWTKGQNKLDRRTDGYETRRVKKEGTDVRVENVIGLD